MKLEGSCHCGAVRFSVVSHTPYPYNRCYCTICRKSAGGGGYAINIMADAKTLKIDGGKSIGVYRSKSNEHNHLEDDGLSSARRSFCKTCGTALWVSDPKWPDAVYPFASAFDTALPRPDEHTVMMTQYAEPWAEITEGSDIKSFDQYPDEGIEDWHRARDLYDETR